MTTSITSILASAYASTPITSQASNKPYTNVDPKTYDGTWKGTYSNGKKFELTISDVSGFKARVKYQSGADVQYQEVLIRDSSFRIGDTKFVLGGKGTAIVGTAVTDPVTGDTSLVKGTAKQS
jgi:hypothetical protein